MKIRTPISILLSLTLAASVFARPKIEKRQVVFNAAEFASFIGDGNCTIRGQAFLKTRSGDVKLGAGNLVYLMPLTKYTTEWFEKSVVAGRLIEQPVNLDRYQRKTIADAQGNFEFTNVPAGKYYVTCFISWEYVGVGLFGGATTAETGAVAFGIAKASADRVEKVIVTR